MIKIDLKDAYFSVPVSKQRQPLLRFLHKGARYQLSCLPFGLGSAPRFFTKLLKPVVALLRRLGLTLIIHLDGIIVFNQTQEGILRDKELNPLAASAFRLCDQLEEVSFTSSPVHGIPRFCHQLPRDKAFLANRENVPTSPGLQRPYL